MILRDMHQIGTLAVEVITKAEHEAALKVARGEAIHGRTKLCLVCGAKEPCELKHDPNAPCDFEMTPMELMQMLKAKDEKLTTLQAWYDKTYGLPPEEIRHAQQLEELEEKYNTLLDQAISIAQMATSFPVKQYPVMVKEALQFLDRPEVQARRKV